MGFRSAAEPFVTRRFVRPHVAQGAAGPGAPWWSVGATGREAGRSGKRAPGAWRGAAARAKPRAQRKRTRFGLVTPEAGAPPPKKPKPDTGGEVTSTRTPWTARGDWGGRAATERGRVLGDPATRTGNRATTDGNPKPSAGVGRGP